MYLQTEILYIQFFKCVSYKRMHIPFLIEQEIFAHIVDHTTFSCLRKPSEIQLFLTSIVPFTM